MVHKVGQAIPFSFLLKNSDGTVATGKAPTYTVIDESNNAAAPVAATEDAGGRYRGTLTPDAAGTWKVQVDCADPVAHEMYDLFVSVGLEKDISDAVDTEVAAILSDTDELQAEWVDGGRLDLILDAVKTKTDTIAAAPAAADNADAVWDEAMGHTTAGTAGKLIADIKTKTDLIPAAPASQGDVTTVGGKVDTIDPYFDVQAADSTANTLERDVVGNKTDAAVTSVTTTKSLMAYLKGVLNEVESGTYGLSHLNTQVDSTVTNTTKPAADATANAVMADVVGDKADAAQQTVGTTRSLMGYIKALLTNLTSTRAGYLDKLNITGNVANQGSVDVVDGYFDVPTADVATNAQERDVVGNKTDAAVTAVGTTKSITAYAKGLVTMGTVQAADSTNNAFAGDVVGNKTDAAVMAVGTTKSIAAYVKGLVTMHTKPAADSTNNVYPSDVIGAKDDAAQTTVGTTRSLMGYLKGVLNQTVKPAADSTSNVTLGDVVGSKDDAAQQTVAATRSLMGYIKAILTNMTSTRAGYIDRLIYHEHTRTFFSDVQASASIPAVAADVSLPSVVLPNMSGTIVSVKAGVAFRMIENTNASANKINGAQNIQVQKGAGSFASAINLVDDQWGVAGSTREGGTVQVGDNEMVGAVDAFNATYNMKITSASADQASLVLYDVQTFLIVTWY